MEKAKAYGKDFGKKNGIEKWAKDYDVEKRINNIGEIVDGGLKVTKDDIKKTLKAVMAKNHAKTTLIS